MTAKMNAAPPTGSTNRAKKIKLRVQTNNKAGAQSTSGAKGCDSRCIMRKYFGILFVLPNVKDQPRPLGAVGCSDWLASGFLAIFNGNSSDGWLFLKHAS